MKSAFILWAIFLTSCASSGLIPINSTVKLKVKDGIDSAKAYTVASQFIEAARRWNINGVIKISYFEESYQKQCNESSFALQEHGKFCNAQYVISHSRDFHCFGGSRVLETCNGGECIYEIGTYMEVCE